MPVRKTAIALPEQLLDEIDQVAKSRQVSRSRFITRILIEAMRARRDADITRRLNTLFSDESIANDQRTQATQWNSAASDWSDEQW